MQSSIAILLLLVASVYSAPQLISFGKDGKIGVNFGGYHAGVGLGGLFGGGAGGGLFAEAGTPFGQSAKAGLGGSVGEDGHAAGGLYAGATAGGDVKAEAGLSGVVAEKAAGSGYAAAQAGPHRAASGLGGESSVAGSSGFTISGTKSFGVNKEIVKEIVPVERVEVIKIEKPKKHHKEVKLDVVNEIKPVYTEAKPVYTEVKPLQTEFKAEFDAKTNVNQEVAPTAHVDKEVIYQPVPSYEKHIVHYKPRRHHFRKTAYVGGYIGGSGEVPPPPPAHAQVVHVRKVHAPVLEKRVDVVESPHHEAAADFGGSGHIGYRKEVTFQRNPTFFADIFNIPISTLKAVGNFLGNTAGSTNVSVQKTASIHTEPELSYKHAHVSDLSTISSGETHVSVQTPTASKVIEDILAIPINTLGAVNKFLENNVPAKRKVVLSDAEGSSESVRRVRLGPHARRRANKHAVIIEDTSEEIH